MMGIYIPNLEKPKWCCELLSDGSIDDCIYLTSEMSCLLQPESESYDCDKNYETCPIIELDLYYGVKR